MAERPLDLGWIRTFEAVGRLGNLTAAGRELGLSQPAVSYTIRCLEEQIGQLLIVREHRGCRMTEAGLLLYQTVATTVPLIDKKISEIRNLDNKSTINLYTDYGFASCWFIPRVSRFRDINPDTEVRIIGSHAEPNRNDKPNDVTIYFGKNTHSNKNSIQLFQEEVVPVSSSEFFRNHNLSKNSSRIGKLPLLHLETNANMHCLTWHDWFTETRTKRFQKASNLTLNTYALVLQAAHAHQGIALGWRGLVDDALSNGTLVPLGDPIVRPNSGYWLHTTPHPSEHTKKFIDWVLSEIP
ncbi:LysR family transcriptional regulator [Acetobacter sp.]|uniref:LysR family transcriptional regulator n=1 Tax=Acetobacter sp. TaxID=440 RepID=UPI0039EA321A